MLSNVCWRLAGGISTTSSTAVYARNLYPAARVLNYLLALVRCCVRLFVLFLFMCSRLFAWQGKAGCPVLEMYEKLSQSEKAAFIEARAVHVVLHFCSLSVPQRAFCGSVLRKCLAGVWQKWLCKFRGRLTNHIAIWLLRRSCLVVACSMPKTLTQNIAKFTSPGMAENM